MRRSSKVGSARERVVNRKLERGEVRELGEEGCFNAKIRQRLFLFLDCMLEFEHCEIQLDGRFRSTGLQVIVEEP